MHNNEIRHFDVVFSGEHVPQFREFRTRRKARDCGVALKRIDSSRALTQHFRIIISINNNLIRTYLRFRRECLMDAAICFGRSFTDSLVFEEIETF